MIHVMFVKRCTRRSVEHCVGMFGFMLWVRCVFMYAFDCRQCAAELKAADSQR